jgi:hypothetical protein
MGFREDMGADVADPIVPGRALFGAQTARGVG